MLTSVVLALSTILLHQTYLRLADLYGRYVDGMRLQGWINDRLWDARETIVYSDGSEDPSGSGTVELGAKSFDWRQSVRRSGRGLSEIRLDVSWFEGNRPQSLTREIDAFRKELR